LEQLPLANLFAFIIVLCLSAFFSAAETAFTAANRIRLRHLIGENTSISKRLEAIYKNPKQLITAILLGNNLANVAASTLATAVLLNLLQGQGMSMAASMTIITIFMTILLLIFGEITPKTFAIKQPETLAISFSKFILPFMLFTKPIIIVFQWISYGIGRIFGISTEEDKRVITVEEIKTMLTLGSEEGVLEKEKKEMLHSVFEFSETVVREIMTPRTDTVCISVEDTVRDAIHLIIEKGHSRIPVYEERIDNIIGIIYAKDLLSIIKSDQQDSIRKFMRQAVFIPESKNVEELLQQMKRAKFHLAIVVDEYGGMAGIVTLEDIIEEIIGEIQDEYDVNEETLITQLKNGGYLVDAGMNTKDLGEKINFEFPEDDDYDTIGGFVLSALGKFPAQGEKLTYKTLLIIVKEISKRRIHKVEIQKKGFPLQQ
jgi:putative hemolysin